MTPIRIKQMLLEALIRQLEVFQAHHSHRRPVKQIKCVSGGEAFVSFEYSIPEPHTSDLRSKVRCL
jgi:hypothetical protein